MLYNSPLKKVVEECLNSPLSKGAGGCQRVETQNFASLHIVGAIYELPLRIVLIQNFLIPSSASQ